LVFYDSGPCGPDQNGEKTGSEPLARPPPEKETGIINPNIRTGPGRSGRFTITSKAQQTANRSFRIPPTAAGDASTISPVSSFIFNIEGSGGYGQVSQRSRSRLDYEAFFHWKSCKYDWMATDLQYGLQDPAFCVPRAPRTITNCEVSLSQCHWERLLLTG
jgi:hypothetical protein